MDMVMPQSVIYINNQVVKRRHDDAAFTISILIAECFTRGYGDAPFTPVSCSFTEGGVVLLDPSC